MVSVCSTNVTNWMHILIPKSIIVVLCPREGKLTHNHTIIWYCSWITHTLDDMLKLDHFLVCTQRWTCYALWRKSLLVSGLFIMQSSWLTWSIANVANLVIELVIARKLSRWCDSSRYSILHDDLVIVVLVEVVVVVLQTEDVPDRVLLLVVVIVLVLHVQDRVLHVNVLVLHVNALDLLVLVPVVLLDIREDILVNVKIVVVMNLKMNNVMKAMAVVMPTSIKLCIKQRFIYSLINKTNTSTRFLTDLFRSFWLSRIKPNLFCHTTL